MAQASHASFEFSVDHPRLTKKWREESNYLVIVAVPDEYFIKILGECARVAGLPYTLVREPDYGDTLTAVALAPGEEAAKLCAQYPLALKTAWVPPRVVEDQEDLWVNAEA